MDTSWIDALRSPLVYSLMAMIAANFIIAVVAALVTKQFQFAKLGDVALKRIVGYAVPFLVLRLVAVYEPSWGVPAMTALYGVLMAALTAHIVASLGEIGIPIPENVMSVIKKLP